MKKNYSGSSVPQDNEKHYPPGALLQPGRAEAEDY